MAGNGKRKNSGKKKPDFHALIEQSKRRRLEKKNKPKPEKRKYHRSKKSLMKKAVEKRVDESLSQADYPLTDYERTHLQTLCEIVTEMEVYTLRENPDFNPSDVKSRAYIRDKRICGRLRSTNGMQLRCLLPAGHRTNHIGWGFCHYHIGRVSKSPLTILEGYHAAGMALDLKEIFEIVPGIFADDTKFGEVNDEIHVLNQLLKYQLNAPDVDSAEIRRTVKALANAKMARQRIKTERLQIDLQSLRMFVKAMFAVLKKHLSVSQYSRVVTDFNDRVALPVNKHIQVLLEADSVTEIQSTPLSGEIVRQPKFPGSVGYGYNDKR